MKKITKNTILADILKVPQAEEILQRYELPCLNCPFAQMEMEHLKIGDICKIYHLKLRPLLKDLNNLKKKDNVNQ